MESANKKRKWNTRRSLAAGVIALVASAISLGCGRYVISPFDVIRVLFPSIFDQSAISDTIRHVVFFVRLPRILGALLCGAALAA